MGELHFPSLELKRVSVKIGMCQGDCNQCTCKSIIDSVLRWLKLTTDEILAHPDEVPADIRLQFFIAQSRVGRIVEEWVGEHEHVIQFHPVPLGFLDVLDDEL